MTGDTMVKICRRRRRFSAEGLVGFADQLRSGRPSAITPRQWAQIVGRVTRPQKYHQVPHSALAPPCIAF
jgi:hypothetical protein